MTKKQLEELYNMLVEIEWRFVPYDNSADEYQCPDFCCIKEGHERFHTRGCRFKMNLDNVKKACEEY
jgi:hypothetical protein